MRATRPHVPASFADVDPRVREILAAEGIKELYPPQAEALGPALSGKNLVVSIPTASGKSLVAYLALLHRYLTGPPGGKGLYIVPLRALASEKYDELRAFRPLGLKVGLATGDLDEEDDRLSRFDIVIATSEKADSLMRHRAGWMQEVRTIVVDEVHLIHDGDRGPTLEVLLARFRALNPSAQILALSATIKNARELADWLEADLVLSDWRPTPLKKGVALERTIEFYPEGKRAIGPDTGDPVADLVLDMLDEGGQALVFVGTRRSAEATARKLSAAIKGRLKPEERAALEALSKQLVDEGEPSLSGKRLGEFVRGGAAFHNAGLGSKQRRLLEQSFRSGLVKVLAATPTLAAGVNTPARRVIIRDLYRFDSNTGNNPLPVLEVQQMMGRAGRPRYDAYGEAVLLAKTPEDRDMIVTSYLAADPEPITSKLGSEPALRVHTLASVAAGFTLDRKTLEKFLESTFYAHQGESWLIKEQLQHVLRFLVDNDFLHREGDKLRATLFGKRTSDLYIDPLSALRLRTAIERAQKRPKVTSFAALQAISSTPDIDPLYLKTKDSEWVYERLAKVEDDLLFEPHEARSHEEFLSHVKTACLLEDWIEEASLETLEERYGLGPGDIRNKVDLGEWLAHAMRELARLFHFETAAELNDLPLRIRNGVKKELLPLIELEGIGRVRARILHRSGFGTVGAIRKAREAQLALLPGFGPQIAKSLKRQVGSEKPEEAALESFSGVGEPNDRETSI